MRKVSSDSNSKFIEKMIKNPGKTKSSEISDFLNGLLKKIYLVENMGDIDNIDFTLLDEIQTWSYIENLAKNTVNSFKNYVTKESGTSGKISQEIVKLNKDYQNLKRQRDNARVEKEDYEDLEEGEEEEEDIEGLMGEEGDEIEDGQEAELNNEPQEEGEEGDLPEEDDSFDMQEFQNIGDDDFAGNNDENEEGEEDEEAEVGEQDGDLLKDPKNMTFDNFFGKVNKEKQAKKKKGESDEEDESEEDMENNIFDIEDKFANNIEELKKHKNKNIQSEIEAIEGKMMEEKKWDMKGEVTSRQRPKNSLVENYLDFEVTMRNPPVPTEEYTNEIEKIIKLRIRDEMFDNPKRKMVVDVNRNSGFDLNFAKSKEGLGQLYENDYLGETGNTNKEEDSKLKSGIEEQINDLFSSLDKLSSFNFIKGTKTAKNVSIKNIASIAVEDFTYATGGVTNDKTPNELYHKKDTELVTRDELNHQERTTSHNKWKRNVRNRLRTKENVKKLQKMSQNYDSKFEVKMAMKQQKDKQTYKQGNNKELKSSNFFSNIQSLAETSDAKKQEREAKRQKTQ